MNYLALDASTEACSVALLFDGKITGEFELCPQSHSLVLLPMIDKILKAAGCQLSELDGIVFGQGPGSFTGVRIGTGVVQGLAFSANLPVVGISTLQAMAQQAYEAKGQTKVIATIDARMAEVYAGCYQVDQQGIMQPVMAEVVLAPEQLAQHLVSQNQGSVTGAYAVGSGWQTYPEQLSNLQSENTEIDILYPHASAMLTLAQPIFDAKQAVSAEHAQPKYVRNTVSWKKLPGR